MKPVTAGIKRGKTAPGRLRALDEYLIETEAALLTRQDGPFEKAVFLDLGFGEEADTFLEAVTAFRRLSPTLVAVGAESALHRVERATETAQGFPGVFFDHRGFEAADSQRSVRLLRVMNVLREYSPEAVPDIHATLGRQLLPGGLLVVR